MQILIVLFALFVSLSVPYASSAASLLCGFGLAPCAVSPVQETALFNTQTTGAATTAVTVTLTALPNLRSHVYAVDARCNTAAATSTLTITDGGVTIFSSQTAITTTAANYEKQWNPPLTGATNSAVVITWAACSAGTGTLIVQAGKQ